MKNLCIIILILIISNALFAGKKPHTRINWQKGYVISVGKASIDIHKNGSPIDDKTGAMTSINKARIDTYARAKEKAIENIVKEMKKIRVDSEKKLADFIIEEDFTKERVSKNLLKWLKIHEYPYNFYTSICEVRLNLEDLITALPIDFPLNNFPVSDRIPISTDYSSLIIDSRGLGIEPMLLPSIYNEDGLEIYGKQFIDSKYLSHGGITAYCYNENQAVKNNRAGSKPYFTIALKSIRNCPVISERDTRRILSSKRTIKNLKHCKVIFILDRRQGM